MNKPSIETLLDAARMCLSVQSPAYDPSIDMLRWQKIHEAGLRYMELVILEIDAGLSDPDNDRLIQQMIAAGVVKQQPLESRHPLVVGAERSELRRVLRRLRDATARLRAEDARTITTQDEAQRKADAHLWHAARDEYDAAMAEAEDLIGG